MFVMLCRSAHKCVLLRRRGAAVRALSSRVVPRVPRVMSWNLSPMIRNVVSSFWCYNYVRAYKNVWLRGDFVHAVFRTVNRVTWIKGGSSVAIKGS